MPAEVLEVTKKFMRDPIRILVKKEELTLEGIKQFYINVEREVRLNSHQHDAANVLLSKAPCLNCRSRASPEAQLLWTCQHGFIREEE